MNTKQSTSSNTGTPEANPGSVSKAELEALLAIRSLRFGSVEVVVHNGRIAEVVQHRRTRFQSSHAISSSLHATGHPETY